MNYIACDMVNEINKRIIENYIKAYNDFDVDKMLVDMDDSVHFENISNGAVTLVIDGIDSLRNQAEQAKQFFKQREQRITGFTFDNDQVEIAIDYKAVLAIDLPNGLKAGDKIELKGKSIFKFRNHRIIELKDVS